MDEILIMVRFDSFWSVWFWLAHVVCWSLVGHFPLSVPFDMVTAANRADNEDGPEAMHCQALIDAAVWRITNVVRRNGALVILIWCFVLSGIATLGFWFNLELSRALMTILGPMTLIYAYAIYIAFKIEASGARGPDARKYLRHQRLMSQIIGMFGVISAATLAVFQVVSRMSTF